MKVEITIPESSLRGLLACAFDGGIGYWAQIADYEGEPLRDCHEPSYIQLPLLGRGAVVLMTTDDRKLHRLDRDAIVRGLQLMAEHSPQHFADLMTERYDATTGDVFIQLCVLGALVYG